MAPESGHDSHPFRYLEDVAMANLDKGNRHVLDAWLGKWSDEVLAHGRPSFECWGLRFHKLLECRMGPGVPRFNAPLLMLSDLV